MRIPRGPWKCLSCGFEGLVLVGGWKPGRRYIRCVSAGQRPRERAEPSIGERLLFIHCRNDFSNAYNLKHANEGFASPCSIRVIGPLNSYYYMAHGHNYVVHLVLLGPPPAPRNDGMAGTHLLASSSLILPLRNLLSELQLCCVPVEVGRGPLSLPWGK